MSELRLRQLLYNKPWMIWFAISLHLLYGLGLIIWPSINVVAIIGGFQHLLEWFGKTGCGVVLTFVAVAAIVGLYLENRVTRWIGIILLMPQYIVLLLALFSGLILLIDGFYFTSSTTGQTTKLPAYTVIAGIGPICLAAFWHTLAILSKIFNNENEDIKTIELLRNRILELERERNA